MTSLNKSDLPINMNSYAKLLFGMTLMLLFAIFADHARSFIPVVLIVAGSAWVGWGLWIIHLSRSSKHWPTVSGIILENSIGMIVEPLERYVVYYFPKIAYRYTVNGVEYVSCQTALFPSDLRISGGGMHSLDDMKSPDQYHHAHAHKTTAGFCQRFPLHSEVVVHYNPQSPQQAVLVVGALSRSWQHSIVFIFVGCSLFLICAFLVYVDVWLK